MPLLPRSHHADMVAKDSLGNIRFAFVLWGTGLNRLRGTRTSFCGVAMLVPRYGFRVHSRIQCDAAKICDARRKFYEHLSSLRLSV